MALVVEFYFCECFCFNNDISITPRIAQTANHLQMSRLLLFSSGYHYNPLQHSAQFHFVCAKLL